MKYRFNVDRAFPLSDHADFYDIVEYIKQANPKKVNFMHGDGREIEDEIKCLTPTKIVSGTHP